MLKYMYQIKVVVFYPLPKKEKENGNFKKNEKNAAKGWPSARRSQPSTHTNAQAFLKHLKIHINLLSYTLRELK